MNSAAEAKALAAAAAAGLGEGGGRGGGGDAGIIEISGNTPAAIISEQVDGRQTLLLRPRNKISCPLHLLNSVQFKVFDWDSEDDEEVRTTRVPSPPQSCSCGISALLDNSDFEELFRGTRMSFTLRIFKGPFPGKILNIYFICSWKNGYLVSVGQT